MKELTIEQKAIAYDNAIENAKEFYTHCKKFDDKNVAFILETVFPELKEESEDERIRNNIIHLIKKSYKQGGYALHKDESEKMLAWLEKQGHEGKKWIYEDVYIKEKNQVFQDGVDEVLENPQKYGLEKQGEQNLADKVEPKFKVGDWVVFNNKHQSIYQVEKIEDGYYILRHTHGGTLRGCVLHDESLRLWTIQDAKDGDVLYLQHEGVEHVIIYKGLVKKIFNTFLSAYCAYNGWAHDFCFADVSTYACITSKRDEKDIHPATKEQRDILFQKMKEAGYEWDDGKKELKKITMKYIDLGLLSGTLWADTNEEGEGFYTFGEAVVKYGYSLPTKEQWEELIKECRWEWNGSGYNVTGHNGNSIILPAAGGRYFNEDLNYVGFRGNYRSSTPCGSGNAWYLCFDSSGVGIYNYYRCYGFSVRLVK